MKLSIKHLIIELTELCWYFFEDLLNHFPSKGTLDQLNKGLDKIYWQMFEK
jgi:hypothetical protein